MNSLENISVILAMPDLLSKTKLREALRNVLYKSDVQYSRSLREFEGALLQPDTRFDVGFVSSNFPIDDISLLLKNLENQPKDTPAIIISLPSANSKSSAEIASLYLEGVAGFISEPYTVEDVANLLEKVIEQKAKIPISNDVRSKKAFNFIMSDAIKRVDEMARLNLDGKTNGYALRDLRNISKKLGSHFESDPQRYEEGLIELFQKSSPPSWGKATDRRKVKVKAARHPGMLVAEMIINRNISAERLAELLAIDVPTVNALSLGQISVNETLSKGLSRVFGMSPKEWLRMQQEWDAYSASNKT